MDMFESVDQIAQDIKTLVVIRWGVWKQICIVASIIDMVAYLPDIPT